jgi:hypothetical protein
MVARDETDEDSREGWLRMKIALGILNRRGSQAEQHALRLAGQTFPACPAHRREAGAVCRALGDMRGKPLDRLDLDLTVAELLPELMASRSSGIDSLEAIQLQMALEAEEKMEARDIVRLAAREVADEKVMNPLLGRWARHSGWDPRTIWVRSLRGVINERVRHSGGCVCDQTA